MAYKSLYRKYRPNDFSTLCGQDHIVKTLENCLKNNKIGHAYLFTGTRGTGKTTTAKIFARMVNCLNPIDNMPCGKCEVCLNTNTDELQDIIEIDAASNNGVDEIRELKNKVKLVPSFCKYKVYIIDEVHMLSIGAFNALLKTLEEPPSHVIFILATTDPQKMPITVISRCQRFDFKKISIESIVKRLKYICEQEKIDAEDSALEEIAKLSDGALRDAIGLLDQVNNYKNGKITCDDIYEINGSLPKKEVFELISLYLNKDYEKILDISEKIYMNGKNFVLIANDMLYIFRDMFIYKNAPKYFEKSQNIYQDDISNLALKIDTLTIEKIINKLSLLVNSLKESNYQRILFEIFMMSDLNEEQNDSIKKNKINIKNNTSTVIKEKQTNNNTNDDNLKKVEQKIEIKQPTKIMKTIDESIKNILINNTLYGATSSDKLKITKFLSTINEYLNDKKYSVAASILQDCEVNAASKDHLLITYKYQGLVAETDEKIDLIQEFFESNLKSKYKIVAITIDEWNSKRPYYLNLVKTKQIQLIEEQNEKESNTQVKNDFLDIIEEE